MSGISSYRHGNSLVVKPVGQFVGKVVCEFDEMARVSATDCTSVILDLSATCALGLEAMGALISVNSRLRSKGLELSLTGVGGAVRRVLAATLLDRNLRIVPSFLPAKVALNPAGD
jgi:anti-anti-sigma regulatory factor